MLLFLVQEYLTLLLRYGFIATNVAETIDGHCIRKANSTAGQLHKRYLAALLRREEIT